MTRRPTTTGDIAGAIARLRSGAANMRQTIMRNVVSCPARVVALGHLDAALNSAIEGVPGEEPADGG